MIWFKIGLDLTPFVKIKTDVKSYISFDKPVSKNKIFQLSFSKLSNTEFSFWFDALFKGTDHGGISVIMQIWRYCFVIRLYDKRRWDYQYNQWDETFDLTEVKEG